jgi:hypothetical protein
MISCAEEAGFNSLTFLEFMIEFGTFKALVCDQVVSYVANYPT